MDLGQDIFKLSGEKLAMKEFKQFLLDLDLKPRTIKRHLANFKRISAECSNFQLEEIEEFFATLKEQGLKNTYLNSLTCTLRVYGKFANSTELQSLKFRKKQEFAKATMSDEEIEAFLNMSCPKHACKSTFKIWTLFFSIMAYTGMRPGEVAQLQINDVDYGRNVFVIEDTKTNKPALSPIPPNITGILSTHLSQLEGKYLFPSKLGGNKDGVTPVFDNVDWHYNFHKRIKLLGIKRSNLTPYSLRHSFSTSLLDTEAVNLFAIKDLMHHSDLRSTLVYSHLSTKHLQKAVQKHPNVRKATDPHVILHTLTDVVKNFHFESDPRFKYLLIDDGESITFELRVKKTQH